MRQNYNGASFCKEETAGDDIRQIPKWYSCLVKAAFGTSMFIVAVLVFFCSGIDFACKKEFVNICLLLLLAGIFLILLYLICKIPWVRDIGIKHISGLSLILLIIQIWLISLYYFKTGWDVGCIIDSARQAARGEAVTAYSFSRYPNNIVLTWAISKVFSLGTIVKISENKTYFLLIIIQSIINTLAGVLTYRAARTVTNEKLAFAGFVTYWTLVGLSPWTSIPYSDSCGLIFPIAIINLYLAKEKAGIPSNCIKWILIGFTALMGYKIKPQIFIVLISIIITEVACSFPKFKAIDVYRKIVGIFLGIAVAYGATGLIIMDFGFPINNEETFGVEHFIAMGLNEATNGVYSGDDVRYSASFNTRKERKAGDLALARKRLNDFGLYGLIKHLARKTLTTYNDGTFAWGAEGNFYAEILPPRSRLAIAVRGLYYSYCEKYKYLMNAEQSIWLAVIVLTLLSLFGKLEKEHAIIMVSLFGVFSYNLLFEPRARYLFIFSPLFIILAMYGAMNIQKHFKDNNG